MWTIIFLVGAIILFILAAFFVFGTFGVVKLDDAVGCVCIGLAAFAASHLPIA